MAELMSQMFYNCKSLKYLDVSNFNTISLFDTNNMFNGCSELTSIKINFIGEKLLVSFYMFKDCNKLTSIDLSSLVGENIKNIDSMFDSCNNLKFIDLSNFNTSSVKEINNTFKNIYPNGTLKYNSKKFNTTFILDDYLRNWDFIDVSNSD